MTDRLDALAGLACDCSQPHTRSFEQPHGRILYTVRGEQQTVILEGDCALYALLDTAFADRRAERFPAPTGVLVDLTRFTGSVDWGFIRSIATVREWQPPRKIACVTENGLLVSYIKILNALLPGPEYRVFAADADAVVWLGW